MRTIHMVLMFLYRKIASLYHLVVWTVLAVVFVVIFIPAAMTGVDWKALDVLLRAMGDHEMQAWRYWEG